MRTLSAALVAAFLCLVGNGACQAQVHSSNVSRQSHRAHNNRASHHRGLVNRNWRQVNNAWYNNYRQYRRLQLSRRNRRYGSSQGNRQARQYHSMQPSSGNGQHQTHRGSGGNRTNRNNSSGH